MARAKKGDTEAFRQLVERYQTEVLMMIYHMVRQRELAEDLAQETFLQVYQSFPQFDGCSRFTTWVHRIARNKVIDWTRSKASKTQSGEQPLKDVYASDASVEEEIIGQDTYSRLQQLIEELPARYRDVLTLYFERDLSFKEIARELHIPKKTAQTRYYRGKQKLFERWQEVNNRAMPNGAKTNVGIRRAWKR